MAHLCNVFVGARAGVWVWPVRSMHVYLHKRPCWTSHCLHATLSRAAKG